MIIKMIKVLFVVFILLQTCFYSGLCAQHLNTVKLDSFITAIESNDRAMFSICLAEKGNVIYQRSVGWIDTNLTLKSNSNSKYRIGSITKMFTSVMIMQLVEQKSISLSTTLSKFFPKVKNASKITIEQMLCHQSGIHNFTNDEMYFAYYTQPQSRKDMLKKLVDLPTDFEPGTKQEYSNSNYVLLGYIIEKISRKTFEENLKLHITDRIGLKNTVYGTKADMNKNEARSFKWTGTHWKPDKETDMSIPHGAGAIVSTTNELVKFIHALFSYQLVSKSSLENMITKRTKMGLGIFSIPFEQKKGYGHNGGIDEFGSKLVYFPEDSLSVAITCNGSHYSINEIMKGALSCYYNKPFQIPTFISYQVSEKILEGYVGTYSSDVLKMDLVVTKQGNSIMLEATGQPPILLESTSDTVFSFDEAGAIFEFKKDTNGVTNQVALKQGGMEFLFQRKN